MYVFPRILKDRAVVRSLGKSPPYAVSVEVVLKDEPRESFVKTVCSVHPACSIFVKFLLVGTHPIPKPCSKTQFLLLLLPVMLIPRAQEL